MNDRYNELLEQISEANVRKLRTALRETMRFVDSLDHEANSYDGTGQELMSSISKILRACQDINPSIQSLADDFRSCWESYSFAEQATLGEAFGINRPRNWDHQAARFRIQKSLDIFVKVQEHRNNGLTVNRACRAVAKEYPRGAGTIKGIYYEYKQLAERMNLPLSRIRQKKKFVLT